MSETPDYERMIAHVRNSMGPPPRRPYFWRHRVGDIEWAKNHPPLQDIARRQGTLLREGDIVWGALVQANFRMFKNGIRNYPGNPLYSRDPRMDSQPDFLRFVAIQLFAAKGGIGEDRQVRAIGDMLQSELGASQDLRVPPELTNDIQCFVTNVQFERRHLPRRRVSNGFMPILIDPRMCAAIVAPYWHWPPELIALHNR